MYIVLQPWQFFFVILTGYVSRKPQKIIAFYQAELKAVMKAQSMRPAPPPSHSVVHILVPQIVPLMRQ